MITGVLLSTKSCLHSVRNLIEIARTRLSEETFSRFFYQSISREIEEADLLLDNFVQFLSANPSLERRGTVHRLMEGALGKHQIQLCEKRVRLSKKYDKNLPEIMVPDEPLSYILDSVFQYGISTVTPGGDMECSTKSFKLEKGMTVRKGVLRRDKRYIQIQLLFRNSPKQGEGRPERSVFREDPLSILLLQLVHKLVRKHQGIMKLRKDERQATLSISVWFPSERRECFALVN